MEPLTKPLWDTCKTPKKALNGILQGTLNGPYYRTLLALG